MATKTSTEHQGCYKLLWRKIDQSKPGELKVEIWANYQELPLSYKWAIFFGCILLGAILQRITKFILGRIRERGRIFEKLPPSLTRLQESHFERPLALLVACGVWFVAANWIPVEGVAKESVFVVIQILLFAALIWTALIAVEGLSHFLDDLVAKTDNTIDDLFAPLVTKSLKVFVVIFGVLLALQNLGINVLSLLAGLGLGGLALALAAKDTAANFFGSITIILDRPFKIGDWIKVNDIDGTVEEIGFRSTRIRTFYKSLVSVPNSIVANERIDNMGERPYRRTFAKLGLTYSTKPEEIELFCEGAKKIIQSSPRTLNEPIYVFFSGYGDFALEIMVYFFHDVANWAEELEDRHHIYLQILNLANTMGLDFAFPTQTLHVESMPRNEVPSDNMDLGKLKSIAQSFGKEGELSKPQGYGLYTPQHKEG